MAKIHGKVTYISVDGDDLSTYSDNVEWERSGDSHDVTTFGNNSHRKQGGLGDGKATISGWYDSTASTGPRAVLEPVVGTVVPIVHRPEGTGSGKPEDQVNALVAKYVETSAVADYVKWSIDIEFDGDVTSIAQAP